ncbi:MAG: hypothetical protein QMC65_05935 [Candidatus Poseidoniaceae archaeon]|jgi:hypothetical protein|tara:strand:+ start:963 stop:1541 length:579 start_codon:yes stop_codon:yes gene_type:complete
MSSEQDKLNRLLSGDFSPDEIANDPMLVSLAERIYGIKIDPVITTKPRDFVSSAADGLPIEVTEVAPPTDMLIEVIGDLAPALPLPNMELPPLTAIPPLAVKKNKGFQRIVLAGLGFVLLNLVGVWSYVFGSMCQAGDLCPTDGYTRINLMEIYKVNSGYGWSEPVQTGAYGLPDIVAVVVFGIALLMTMRK